MSQIMPISRNQLSKLHNTKMLSSNRNLINVAKSTIAAMSLMLATAMPLKASNTDLYIAGTSTIDNTEQVSDKNIDPQIYEKVKITPAQLEICKKIVNECLDNEYKKHGKWYFKDAEYYDSSILPFSSPTHTAFLNFSNGFDKKSVKIVIKDDHHEIYFTNKLFDPNLLIKIENEKNGDFTVSTLIKSLLESKTQVLNFTKDGRIKKGNYLPNTNSSRAKNLSEEAPKDNTLNSLMADVKRCSFLRCYNHKFIAKIAQALDFNSIESGNGSKSNILFLNGDNCTYRLNVKKDNDDWNTIIGIANKVNSQGQSETYLVKGEFIYTNRSEKFVISKMKVVQDGLDDNAPTTKKDLKITTKTGHNSSNTSHTMNAVARTPWLANLFSINHKNFYDGEISSKTLNEINEIITESNPDGKTVKIISIDKLTEKATVQGK